MVESIIKGIMDAVQECHKREIEANAVLINDRMFFSKTLVYPVGEVPMVCGLKAYYNNDIPDNVLFAVTHVDGADRKEMVEVRHGEWGDTGDHQLDNIYGGWKCSECGFIYCGYKFNFCPNCGAKMDGKGEG
jgi:hypothetical protein